jgi:Tocopherol cyclase
MRYPVLRRVLETYRRSGADLPFGDPAAAHGSAMEGYYWRVVDASAGVVIVILCGVCQGPNGPWAAVALAAHPGGFVRHAVVTPAAGRRDGFGVRAAEILYGSAERLCARLGDDTWIDLRMLSPVPWPRPVFGALGPAHALPGLSQYWHPVVLAAGVEGQACIVGKPVPLDGATAYAEKNWGPRFAGHWWWGHAGAFARDDVTVAFAGGRLAVAGRLVPPTAVVLRLGKHVLRFSPPLARMVVRATDGGWAVRARSPRHGVQIEGDADGVAPHVLPVPDVTSGRVDMRSRQYLAGRLRLRLSRGKRTVFEGESPLAGLERGTPADYVKDPQRGEQPR